MTYSLSAFTYSCQIYKYVPTQKCGNLLMTIRITASNEGVFSTKTCLKLVKVWNWILKWNSHWSADLTQRSRLFICVETNNSCKVESSITSAVFVVSSWQSCSGRCISTRKFITSLLLGMKKYVFVILTFQFHRCLWRTFSIQDFRKINILKSLFSFLPGLLPLIFVTVYSFQFNIFFGYLSIKFSEYGHQRHCKSSFHS